LNTKPPANKANELTSQALRRC